MLILFELLWKKIARKGPSKQQLTKEIKGQYYNEPSRTMEDTNKLRRELLSIFNEHQLGKAYFFVLILLI